MLSCEFCPTNGGPCAICGRPRLPGDVLEGLTVVIQYPAPRRGRKAVLLGSDRESAHQQCGGGRRIFRKTVGHN